MRIHSLSAAHFVRSGGRVHNHVRLSAGGMRTMSAPNSARDRNADNCHGDPACAPRARAHHSSLCLFTSQFDGLRRNSIGVYRRNYFSMAVASASLAVPCVLLCSDSNVSNGTCASAAAAAALAPPLSPVEVEKAAATIQTHFRKFQQKKHKNGK
ncbi:uncharacterized protein LOC121202659 isoform X1 [Betta splendens]|uniref:Uncharacterized protein LOC121202659 isoform X1 n=1 Tax=Betta splendens TaxID=158456 RepID=A0A8M1HL65_BETSP|nr:uncharacterized protein LOC121202659 isoform X1 [Betta splendens]